MISQDSINNNAEFQFPSELKIKEENRQDANQKGGDENYNYCSHIPSVLYLLSNKSIKRKHLNCYKSCIQYNDLNSSQMSIDDNWNQKGKFTKQMSIELTSPSPLKKQKQKSEQQLFIGMKQVEKQEELSHIQTRRKVIKTNYNVDDSPTEEDDFRPCHCAKTHCLQLYCSCFHNRRPCTNECKCNDCYNDGKHEDEVLKAVEQIKLKEQRASHHDLDSFDTKQVWGCKCKKTKCVKGYCECFIRGKKCTSHCQCTECENKRQPKQQQQKPQSEITKIKKNSHDYF